jgi:hypothetical protein
MSELPPSPEESDEVDALYRRVSALDAGRPSESVRRAVLDHAAQLAANRAAGNGPARRSTGRWAKRPMWWRPAALGTLAAAAVAGFLVIPQFLTPQAPIRRASSSAPALSPTPTSSSADVVQTQAAATEPRTALRREAPAAGTAIESVVVTAAKRVPAEGLTRQTAQDATRAQSAPSALTAPMAPTVPTVPGAQLRRAAEMGDVPVLQALLNKQPAIDARDAGGRTALMLATLRGRIQAVEALLSAGADPNAADAHGTTPLQAALAGDQPAIAAALRRAGAR